MTLNLSTPVEDPYSIQLAKGFRSLSFAPSLEAEFRSHSIANQRRPALICSTAGFITWLCLLGFEILYLFSLDSQTRFAPLEAQFFTVRLAVAAIWLASLIGLYKSSTDRPYRHLVAIAYVTCGIGASLCALLATKMQFNIDRSVEIIIIMAAFLPIGMFFYQALALSISIAGFASIVTFFLGIEASSYYAWQLNMALVFAVPVGAVGAYLREYSDREQFLHRNIFRAQAFQDSLTGIANRRLFEQHSKIITTTARRDHLCVVVVMIDIDFFKPFNDHLGHASGDTALRCVAQLIHKNINRPTDMAARLGGEEFGVILYDIQPESAAALLETIRNQLERLDIQHPTSPHGRLTISIGAAASSTSEFRELMKRADSALYRAKSTGRNRLEFEAQILKLVKSGR